MGVGPDSLRLRLPQEGVLIPYSSGMGVGPGLVEQGLLIISLNTLFVRYGCGTRGYAVYGEVY